MIEIQFIEGVNCPLLFCDVCGERVTDAGNAAVVFDNFAPNGARVKALTVHKGNIDGRTCHQEADSLIAGGGGRPGWQELKRHLVDLAANVGFPAKAMQTYDESRR